MCNSQKINVDKQDVSIEILYDKLYQSFESEDKEYKAWIKNSDLELMSEAERTRFIIGDKYSYRNVKFDELSHFSAMKGSKFDSQEIRLMVVGRATNGWGNYDCTTNTSFGKQAENEYKNRHFEWVVESPSGSLCNDTGTYYLRSHFWTHLKAIHSGLSVAFEDKRWVDYIAWTNLYKISPTYMGNPDDEMKAIQHDICIELLKKEILDFKPTHILCFTGWDWISEKSSNGNSFVDIFENVTHDKNQVNIASGPNKNSIYVEGTATFKNAKVVVACRPENRKKDEYVEQVIKAFDEIRC